MRCTAAVAVLFAGLVAAREIPSNVQAFYNSHKKGACPNAVSIKYNSGQASGDTVYCKDPASKGIYLKDTKNGYADVDIDCDGLNSNVGDCHVDGTSQAQTAFKSQVQNFGIEDLDAHIHTYVVLGNDNSAGEGDGGKKFDPKDQGIKPLSVVAVVCGGKLIYGVWGDVNGGKLTGESSLSLAQMCFPDEGLNGNAGHEQHDVLYIAFPGEEAVPGNKANWKAKTRKEFEASLASTGDKLVKKLGSAGSKSRVMKGRL